MRDDVSERLDRVESHTRALLEMLRAMSGVDQPRPPRLGVVDGGGETTPDRALLRAVR